MAKLVMTLQDQKREFTRQRLLDAAAEVFGRKEYHLSTIDDIAKAAGCSRATFYLHFPSKGALVVSLHERGFDASLQRYQRFADLLISRSGLKRSHLRSWLGEWQEVWGESTAGGIDFLHALLMAQVMEPEVEALGRVNSATFIDTLDPFFDSLPAAERATVKARARVLETMSRSIFAMAAEQQLQATDAQYLDYLTDLWADVYIR